MKTSKNEFFDSYQKSLISEKRGISPVIATILIILITIAAFMILATIIIPWAKQSLSKTNCLDIVGKLAVVEDSIYSCYNSDNNKVNLMIERGFAENAEINGIAVSLIGESGSKVFKLKNGTVEGVIMYDGNEDLELPVEGEARTFVFDIDSAVTSAKIAAIIEENKICDPEEFEIPAC